MAFINILSFGKPYPTKMQADTTCGDPRGSGERMRTWRERVNGEKMRKWQNQFMAFVAKILT